MSSQQPPSHLFTFIIDERLGPTMGLGRFPHGQYSPMEAYTQMTMMVVDNTSEDVQAAFGYQFLVSGYGGRSALAAWTDPVHAIAWAQHALVEVPEMGFLRDALIITVPTAALMHIAKYGANALVYMNEMTDDGVRTCFLESDTI